ncbi:MAG: PAS domain S-box protein [Opitutaceae bacterium]|nr:PAS domain S-box protein [Opitutaceae bacterium]
MSRPLHRLLSRQLKRHFGPAFVVPAEWAGFIASVDEAYRESDQDRGMLERSLDLSSQELLHAGSHMRALLQGIPDLLLRVDRAGTILEKQAGAGGGPLAELAAFFGDRLSDLPDATVAGQFSAALARVLSEGAAVSIEYSLSCPKHTCFFEARLVPLLEEECLAIVRNITERKRAEAEERHAVSVLQSTLESTADGILVVDAQGRISSFNRRFAEMWRIPYSVVEARDDAAVIAAGTAQMKDPEGFRRKVRELYASPREVGFDVIEFLDGRVFERYSHPQLLDGAPVGRVWSFHDITNRRRAEERLLKLSGVVEQTADSVVITDAAGGIEYVNPAFTVLTGYTPEDVAGQTPRLLKSGQHSEEFYQDLWDTILAGQIFHAVLVNRKKDGELYYADTTITPIRDGAGAITHFVSTEQDITSHRELEAQLRQAQKMEAFGQLAAGVAHDFNNLLTVIIGNVAMLHSEQAPGTPDTDSLDEISRAAERAANLTQQLLTFSRRRPLQPRDIDVNDVLANMSKMLGRLIGEHIALEARYAPGGAVVHADPGMLDQVLMNLAVNARDAMPSGGSLVLQTTNLVFDAGRVRSHPLSRLGEFVCLAVTDSGVGIAAEHLPKIFEPFFTTKEVGKGTGLGLATVFGIVQQHRGWIEVSSTVGVGTTVRVYLPRQLHPVPLPIDGIGARPAPRGNETVLLVEDEPSVRLLMQHLLENHGYRVFSAISAIGALELWKQHAGAIDLLLTDMVLPGGVNGYELSQQLLREKAELTVIYCSGYADEMLGENSPLRLDGNFLEKPFVPTKFLQRVRDCLDARR